jgi:hypothetical protein
MPPESSQSKWIDAPNEQAWWWHYDPNAYDFSGPFVYSVMYSGTAKRYFIAYPDSRWCNELPGVWMKIETPELPPSEHNRLGSKSSTGR